MQWYKQLGNAGRTSSWSSSGLGTWAGVYDAKRVALAMQYTDDEYHDDDSGGNGEQTEDQ